MKTKSILFVLTLIATFLFGTGIELNAQGTSGSRDLEGVIKDLPMISQPPSSTNNVWQEPFIIGRNSGRPGERNSRLQLSKRYSGETVSTKGVFTVEKTSNMVRLSISGEVRSGSITITLLLPGNETFKKITINNAADIQWSENIMIKEGETKYYGDWKYEVTTETAEGNYRLSINSG